MFRSLAVPSTGSIPIPAAKFRTMRDVSANSRDRFFSFFPLLHTCRVVDRVPQPAVPPSLRARDEEQGRRIDRQRHLLRVHGAVHGALSEGQVLRPAGLAQFTVGSKSPPRECIHKHERMHTRCMFDPWARHQPTFLIRIVYSFLNNLPPPREPFGQERRSCRSSSHRRGCRHVSFCA